MMSVSVVCSKPMRAGLFGSAILLCCLSGCQSWWNRSNSQSLLGFANEAQKDSTDDWEHPSAPSERDMKRGPAYLPVAAAETKAEKPPRVTLPRDRQKETTSPSNPNPDLASLPAPRTSASSETKTADTQPPANSPPSAASAPQGPTAGGPTAGGAVVQAAANSPIPTQPSDVRDSGQSDVDIEGALALLPERYQSILRNRMARQDDPPNLHSTKEIEEKSTDPDPKDPRGWTHELNQSVVALEKLLETDSEMEPAVRSHHEMTLRLLYLAQRNLEQAKRPISGATPHEQEYLEHQLTGLYHAMSPDPNPSRPRHWAQVASEHRHADRHLAALSSLQVSPPVFCTQVDGYGAITKFEKNAFVPDQQVLLYCELENVTSQRVREGFETKVKGNYEIRDAQGKRVLEQPLPMEPDVCNSQRRDFFLVYMIYMPPTIEPGRYELILTMEDQCGNKFGSSKTEFEIKK